MLATKVKTAEPIVDERIVFNEIAVLRPMYHEQPEEEDWFDALPDYAQQQVLDGLKEIEAGVPGIPHSEVRKRYEKWL